MAALFLTSANGKNFYDLSDDPRVLPGLSAPPGSIGLYTPAIGDPCFIYQKNKGGATAWSVLLTGAVLDGYALRELSNLRNTAVNVDVLPGADQVRSLGSEILAWLSVFSKNFTLSDAGGYRQTRKNLDQTVIVDPGFLPFASPEMMWLPNMFTSVKYEYDLIEAVTGEIRHGILQTTEVFNTVNSEYTLYWTDQITCESANFPPPNLVSMDALMGGTALVPTMNYIRVKNAGAHPMILQSQATFVTKPV